VGGVNLSISEGAFEKGGTPMSIKGQRKRVSLSVRSQGGVSRGTPFKEGRGIQLPCSFIYERKEILEKRESLPGNSKLGKGRPPFQRVWRGEILPGEKGNPKGA